MGASAASMCGRKVNSSGGSFKAVCWAGDTRTTPGPFTCSQESSQGREQSDPENPESCKAEEAEAGQSAAWVGWVCLESARLLRHVRELSTEDLQEILKGSS